MVNGGGKRVYHSPITQIKHGLMHRPSSQDEEQLEKPHLLPLSSRARIPARAAEASSLLYHKRKRDSGSKWAAWMCACVCLWGVDWGDRGQETEEGNHRRTTSEGHYVSVQHLSLWNCWIDLLTPSDRSASVGASCLLLPCRTLWRLWPNRASHPHRGG